MSKKKSCPLCDFEDLKFLKEGEKEINRCIYRNKIAMCIIDRNYQTDSHSIVVIDPDFVKDNHPTDFNIINKEQAMNLISVVHKCYQYIKNSESNIERIYVCCLNESGHVHFHLIPRRESDKTGFQFMGENEKKIKDWTQLNSTKRKQRIDAINKMIQKIGRHCDECHKSVKNKCPDYKK
jgi:diadenosine tetraphosphate (Ap4A) HIT family hydrolase